MTLKELLHFSLLGATESVVIEGNRPQRTASVKISDVVCPILVHPLKIGAGVVGKSKTIQQALEGILDEHG